MLIILHFSENTTHLVCYHIKYSTSVKKFDMSNPGPLGVMEYNIILGFFFAHQAKKRYRIFGVQIILKSVLSFVQLVPS